MASRLTVKSLYPNLRGKYEEKGSNDGKPAFLRGGCEHDPNDTWIFYSTRFGRGACWYFGRSLPKSGSLSSFCCSVSDAVSPELASWPAEDIKSIKAGDVDSDDDMGIPADDVAPCSTPGQAIEAPFEIPRGVAPCSACIDLKTLSDSLVCPSCAPSSNFSVAVAALILLREHTSSATRQRLAKDLACKDADAKEKLEKVSAAYQCQDARPVIILEPPERLEVGVATTNLCCEAVSFVGAKVQYQWCKDGSPLRRAERPRFAMCGAGPRDEGSYVCRVSAGQESACTRACNVVLSSEEVARRNRIESPMHRADEAARQGNIDGAVILLYEVIKAAEAEGNEIVSANAYCQRAELLLQLGRWQDAFTDSTAAVRVSPGLSRAHAARGQAAVKLGRLAEAASSWETAEILGGVPEAARQAEECRQRLQEFFAQQQAQRKDVPSGAACAGDTDANPEESWQRNGWQGRYAGGAAGGFFGQGGASTKGSSQAGSNGSGYTRSSAPPRVAPELKRHLESLGFAVDKMAALPSADEVRGAYRRLALQAHPDKPGGSKTAFQDLQNAYEAVLNAIGV